MYVCVFVCGCVCVCVYLFTLHLAYPFFNYLLNQTLIRIVRHKEEHELTLQYEAVSKTKRSDTRQDDTKTNNDNGDCAATSATEERRSARCDVSTLNERKINICVGSCSVFGQPSRP